MKRDASPRLVIVTARGELDPGDRALQAGALVLTTAAAAGQLRKVMPNATEVRAISEADHLEVGDIFDAVQAEGHRTILTEGGPKLFGQFVADDRIDELFLTVSPVLAGRKDDRSFGIIDDVDFGRLHKRSRLLSVRREESYLFVRYRLDHLPPHVGQGRVGA
jgi:riboflavin biosynthesis pyrimidine reductase